MIFDRVLFTRTENEDYHWSEKPSYLGVETERMLRPLFTLAENNANLAYLKEKGRRNLYLLPTEDSVLLCYICLSDRRDAYGRAIYMVEGLAHKSDHTLFNSLRDEIFLMICKLLDPFNEDGFCGIDGGEEERTFCRDGSFLSYGKRRELDEQLNSWGYGNLLERLHSDLDLRGRFFALLLATESESFYPRSYAADESFVFYNSREAAAPEYVDDGDFYEVPEEADHCRLRVFLEYDKKYCRASALLLSGDRCWYQARNLSITEYAQEGGIPLYLLYSLFYRCREKLADCAMDLQPVGDTDRNRESYPGPFFDLWGNMRDLGYEEAVLFEVWHPEEKAKGCYRYEDPEEKAIVDWYRVSNRFGDRYYEHDGRDSIYVVNLESGLWIFRFLVNVEGIRFIRGMMVSGRERRRAFRNLQGLLEQDDSLLLYGKEADLPGMQMKEGFCPELKPYLEQFREASRGNEIFSAVISAIVPIGCREGSRVKWFGPNQKVIQLQLPEKGREEAWDIYPVMLREMELNPDMGSLWHKSRGWNLGGMTLDQETTWENARTLVYRRYSNRIEEIPAEGEVDFAELDQAVQKSIGRWSMTRLYQCPHCNGRSNASSRCSDFVRYECERRGCRKSWYKISRANWDKLE